MPKVLALSMAQNGAPGKAGIRFLKKVWTHVNLAARARSEPFGCTDMQSATAIRGPLKVLISNLRKEPLNTSGKKVSGYAEGRLLSIEANEYLEPQFLLEMELYHLY